MFIMVKQMAHPARLGLLWWWLAPLDQCAINGIKVHSMLKQASGCSFIHFNIGLLDNALLVMGE